MLKKVQTEKQTNNLIFIIELLFLILTEDNVNVSPISKKKTQLIELLKIKYAIDFFLFKFDR